MDSSSDGDAARIGLPAVVLLALASTFQNAALGKEGIEPPIIIPGTSFADPDVTAEAIEPSLPGGDAKVIAHWDIVPNQTFTGTINIGVVAFHINGIDRVDFSANWGPWTSVQNMTLNPQTNVVEYWAVLRAADCIDGPVHVRAIAYPKTSGIPRLVSYNFDFNGGPEVFRCTLYANASGTLPAQVRFVAVDGSDSNDGLTLQTAYATIPHAAQEIATSQGGNAGGGTIYIGPNFSSGVANGGWEIPDLWVDIDERWLTIAGSPGLTPHQVVFASGSQNGLANGLLKLQNLTLQGPNLEVGGQGGGIWFDGVRSIGTDAYSDTGGTCSGTQYRPSGIFVTNSHFEKLTVPLVRQHLTRNVTLREIGDDLFHTPRCAINVTSFKHAEVDTGFHSDFVGWANSLQGITKAENFIFYNVASFDCGPIQGIYDDDQGAGETRDDIAFVNVLIDRNEHSNANGHWSGLIHTNHFLLWHVTHDRIGFRLNTPNITNLSVRGCSWDWLAGDSMALYASAFAENHFRSGLIFGAHATWGEPGYVNVAENIYRPLNDSPLHGRLDTLLTPADGTGLPRVSPTSIGAYEFDPSQFESCLGDTNADHHVNPDDLLQLLWSWGSCRDCSTDIAPKSGDGVVDINDLLALLMNWGPC